MERHKLLLLDDDGEILDYVAGLIKKHFDFIDIIAYDNYNSFLKDFDKIDYDCVLTDIVFGNVNSIDVYNIISKDSKIPLVYMSGNDTRTFDVYDTPHKYFLAKPIDEERLVKAIDRLINNKSYLSFDYYKKSYFIEFKDIMYLESDKRVLHIVTEDNVYQTYGKLDDYVGKMPPFFIRISKSFLVNRNFIKEKDGQTIVLLNGDVFNISRALKKEVENAL